MNMKLRYLSKLLLLTSFVSIALSGCGTSLSKNSVPQNNYNKDVLIDLPTTHDQQTELYEKILLGRISVSSQRYNKALEYYLAALQIRPNIELAREALLLSEQLNSRDNSIFIGWFCMR